MSFFKKKGNKKEEEAKKKKEAEEQQRKRLAQMYGGDEDNEDPYDNKSKQTQIIPPPQPTTTQPTKQEPVVEKKKAAPKKREYRDTHVKEVPKVNAGKFKPKRSGDKGKLPSAVPTSVKNVDEQMDQDANDAPSQLTMGDQFVGLGTVAGIEIWRVEGMEPVDVEFSDRGKFYTGDCYILLKTFEGKDSDTRLQRIHLWLGRNSTSKKRAICAFLGSELFKALADTGRRAQFIEEEGKESKEFLSYFERDLDVQMRFVDHSSSDETLKTYVPPKFTNRLIRVVNENGRVYGKRVAMSKAFMNSNASIVLETEKKIFVFLGLESTAPEQIKAIDIAKMICHEERGGASSIEIIREIDNDDTAEMAKLLGNEKVDIDAIDTALLYEIVVEQEGEDDDMVINKSVKLITDPLTKVVLNNEHTYILETRYEVYAWYGLYASNYERKVASALAARVGADTDRSVVKMYQEGETVLFKERFGSGFLPIETAQSFAERRKKLSNYMKDKIHHKIPAEFEQYEEEKKKPIFDPEDDGSGSVVVYRVIDSKTAVPVPEDEVGHFYTKDCYLIMYEFDRAKALFGGADDDEDEQPEEEEEEEEEEDDYDDDQDEEDDYESDDSDSYSKKFDFIKNMKGIDQSDETEEEREAREDRELEERRAKARKQVEAEERRDRERKEKIQQKKEKLIKKNLAVKKKKIFYMTRRILYCWEGLESDKVVHARVLKKNFKDYVNDPVNPAFLLTVQEGKENDHFMRIFEHMMVVHRGTMTDKPSPYDSRLYRIYCKTVINSKAVEVEKRKSSLNSNDIYVCVGQHTCYVWSGIHASSAKKKIAFKLAQSVITGNKEVTAIDEGMEPEEFWEEIGSETDKYVRNKLRYAQGVVYECAVTTDPLSKRRKFRVMDIGEIGAGFLQQDLTDCHYALLFDMSSMVYVWYPNENPTNALRRLALNAVNEMIKDDEEEEEEKPAQDDENAEIVLPSTDKVKVEEIHRGKEPQAFKMAFPMWREDKVYKDTHAIRQEEEMAKYKQKVRAVLPFVDIMRKKYKELLTTDETVNIHNAIQLLEIGHKCGQNVDMLMNTLDDIQELGFKDRDVELLEKFTNDLMIYNYQNRDKLGYSL